MHNFWTILFGASALAWLVQAVRAGRGLARVPRLKDFSPETARSASSISIIFAARNEAAALPDSLPTLLSQDYPHYEVIAVNDRSEDATASVLQEFSDKNARLKVVEIRELPPGWLGKPHALAAGAAKATGKWLLFTDADVHFEPSTLGRAIRIAEQRGCDHLTLLSGFKMQGFWEKTFLMYFVVGFTFGNEPWNVANRKSNRYAGVGAFQLLRRSTYDGVGGHKRLAMEVIEDMKLGKLVKEGGFSSLLGFAPEFVWLRWYAGLGNIVRGLTKNMFAAMNFSVPLVVLYSLMTFGASVLPFLGVALLQGWAQLFAGIAATIAVLFEAGAAWDSKISPLYGLTQPLGAIIFIWVILRSTVVTLARGGVVWRGTFYKIDELRRGAV